MFRERIRLCSAQYCSGCSTVAAPIIIAVRATAMEEAFGWEPGSFAEAYEVNRRETSEVLLSNEPLVDAI